MARWRIGSGLVTLMLGASILGASATAAQADAFRCEDVVSPTIVGTEGDDRIVGTTGPDVIHGLGGSDVILGLDGDDRICAGPGRDRVVGGGGDDVIDGGAGRDVLRGSAGEDLIYGGSAGDRISGGPGRDQLYGDGGGDLIRGGRSIDVVDGGTGADRCLGNTGFDIGGESCETALVETAVQYAVVDDLQIRFFAKTPDVPENPTRLTMNAIVTEADGEPVLCLHMLEGTANVVNCLGVVIDGLTIDDRWARGELGQRWGWRFLAVTWPPVDERVEIIEERAVLSAFAFGASTTNPTRSVGSIDMPRPDSCSENTPTNSAGVRDYAAWGAANPDRFGGIWVTSGEQAQIAVLRVKGDPAPVLAEFAGDGVASCIEVVDFLESDLETAEQQLRSLGYRPEPRSTRSPELVIVFRYLDRALIDELLGALDRPDLVDVEVNGFMG